MAWIAKDGVNIHYEKIDSEDPTAKETLVLIHGVGLDMYSWDLITPYFKKDYSIIRYDLRGHGESDAGVRKRDVELLADDLTHLLSELDIGSYHIIAQGFGGFIGVLLATIKEKNLKSLILMGVPIHYPKEIGNRIVQQRKDKVAGQKSMLELGKELITKISYQPSREVIDILLNAYKKVEPEVYFELFRLGFGEAVMKNLQKIEVPILILSGSEDEIFPPELTSAILNFNYQARFFTVPYASFMIQMDQPLLVSEWIHGFIDRIKDRRRNVISSEEDYKRNLTSQMYSEIRGMLKDIDKLPNKANELQVNIMKGFSVTLNGKRITEGWGKRKAKQLLIYLVIKQSVTRDELCDAFWPEVSVENARNRLRVSLHHLKHLLEANNDKNKEPILVAGREHVFIQGNVQSDILEYTEAIKQANRIENDVDRAEGYKRLLLERIKNPLPGLYEEYFLQYRSWIENEWAVMALFLANIHEQKKDYKHAIYYMEIALQYETGDMDLLERYQQLQRLKI